MDKKEPVSERESKKLFKQELGKAIKRARIGAKLTQKMLAEKVGIMPAYLSQIETGRRSPSFSLLTKLAAACDIRASQLMLEAELQDGNATKLLILLGRIVEKFPGVQKLLEQLKN